MSDQLAIDPTKSALLVMDYQITVLETFSAASGSAAVLEQMPKLIAAARVAQMTVAYIVVGFRPGYPEVNPRNRVFSMVKENGLLAADSAGAEIHPAVAPQNGEPVVVKHRVSAFAGTDLDMLLKAQDVETLILAGVQTSGVVLSTLRQAADLDYRLVVAGDCCTDPDHDVHHVLLEKIFPRNATVATASEIAQAIRRV